MYWCNLSKYSHTTKHVGVQLWRLPLWTVWELTLTDLGAESQQSWQLWTVGDSLTSPAGILQTGLGWGHRTALVHVEMWVIPSEERIPVEKHLGKAPFYFPLLEICNQTRILKAKESCLTFFSIDFWKSVCSPTPNLFSQRTHSYIERDFKSSALIPRVPDWVSYEIYVVWPVRDSYRPL